MKVSFHVVKATSQLSQLSQFNFSTAGAIKPPGLRIALPLQAPIHTEKVPSNGLVDSLIIWTPKREVARDASLVVFVLCVLLDWEATLKCSVSFDCI